MSHYHAVVWLDHQKAKVFHFAADDSEATTVEATGAHSQHHEHRAGVRDGRRAPVDYGYYEAVVAALGDAKEWLVMGPGSARQEFAGHVAERSPGLAVRIVGLEPADHPTDGQILARARAFFEAADRMRPQRG